MAAKGGKRMPPNGGAQPTILSFFGEVTTSSSPMSAGNKKKKKKSAVLSEDKTTVQQSSKRRKTLQKKKTNLVENSMRCDVDDADAADTAVQRKQSSKARQEKSCGKASHRGRLGDQGSAEKSSAADAVKEDETTIPTTTSVHKEDVPPLGGIRGGATAGTPRAVKEACAIAEGPSDASSPKTDSEASPGTPQQTLQRRQGTILPSTGGGGDGGESAGHARQVEEVGGKGMTTLWETEGQGLKGAPGRPARRREAGGAAGGQGVGCQRAEKEAEDLEDEGCVGTAPEKKTSSGAPSPRTGNRTSLEIPLPCLERRQDDTAAGDGLCAGESSGFAESGLGEEDGDVGRRRESAGRPCKEERRPIGKSGKVGGVRVGEERGQSHRPASEQQEEGADSAEDEGGSDDGTDEEYVDDEDGDDCHDDGLNAEDGNQCNGQVRSDEENVGEEGEGTSSLDTEIDSGNQPAMGESVAVPKTGHEAAQRDGGISEYELQRLERIKANQAFMASLGLATAKPVAPASARGSGSKGDKKRSRPVSRPRERVPQAPVRRSARARGDKAVNYSEDHQAIIAEEKKPASVTALREPEPKPELEEIDFDDSTVLRYLCREADEGGASTEGSGSAAQDPAAVEGSRVVGLRVLAPDYPLSASGLSTIYSMDFCGGGGLEGPRGSGAAPPLLAAGGKGGVVAIFSTQKPEELERDEEAEAEDGEEDERTLMNFKAHKGWVSAVRFVDGGGGGGEGMGGCRLLSSANDSVVKLWDTSKQYRGLPRQLCSAEDLHPTRKGIFSMDCYGKRVATGSKDTTVALASLRPTGLAFDRVLGDAGGSEAFHKKVIKGVSLRDEITVASCGDDSNVRVSDLRCAGPSYRLDGAHDGACHTVRWHPRDVNLLLSAGLDSTMKLHDLRKLDAPLHVFRGHCPYALARPRAIHRPEFLPSGAERFNIVTGGERSDKLSMYDSTTGGTVSRGVLGDEATALAVGRGDWWTASPGQGVIAAAKPGGSVALLTTVWGGC